MRKARVAAVAVAALAIPMLAACSPLQPQTGQLITDMRELDYVEDAYGYAQPDTIFDDPESSISVTVTSEATTAELADLIELWADGVADVAGDVRFSMERYADDSDYDQYDSFDVDGLRPTDDLRTLVEAWDDWSDDTTSTVLSLDDYSAPSWGSASLDYGQIAGTDLADALGEIDSSPDGLPGDLSFYFSASLPTGTFDLSVDGGLPSGEALDVFGALTEPAAVDVGFLDFRLTSRDGGSGDESLLIDVGLTPSGIAGTPDDELADTIRSSDAWLLITELVDRIPRDTTGVEVAFTVDYSRVATLDTDSCQYSQSDSGGGSLGTELWQHWLRDGATSADGSTADTCND